MNPLACQRRAVLHSQSLPPHPTPRSGLPDRACCGIPPKCGARHLLQSATPAHVSRARLLPTSRHSRS
eukprot:7212877-Prymnesium_polylepis.1